MIGTLTLLISVAVTDPRPQLVELQLAGKHKEALAHVDLELAARPEAARRMGFDYLRGHLLDLLGNSREAGEAFVVAMSTTPALFNYSRYRMALEQDRMGHPEVAAGLLATAAAKSPSTSPLIPEAIGLLASTLARGGDCQLLGGIRVRTLPLNQRRQMIVSRADCAVASRRPDIARGLLVSLLEEDRSDEAAHSAAERLSGFVADSERGRLPMLLGLTFHQHRDFDRALLHLRRAFGRPDALSPREVFEARYAAGRAQFWQERFGQAAVSFGELAGQTEVPEQRARALYQQGRAYELIGQWKNAGASFRLAYQAEPLGTEWAAAALLSALRLEWRSGNEAAALPLYDLLATRREWSTQAARASLFMASSDLVRGRADRARPWLDRASLVDGDERLEASYWRGRLAELEKNSRAAVTAYLAVIRPDPYHPMARAALGRLAEEPLGKAAVGEGRRLAGSPRPEDLYAAWLLLGKDEPSGRLAQRNLHTFLLADRITSPYLRLSEMPVKRWPLWEKPLLTPEEILLALGILHEGSPAVAHHFPFSDPSLAFTGGLMLARGGEVKRSIWVAEVMRARIASRLPLSLQARDYQRLLYPNPYQKLILPQARLRGIEPGLLAALIREESVYDRFAISPSSARGLTQMTLQTARRLGAQISMPRLGPEDLYQPEISITLGAFHLGNLLKELGGSPHLAVAAYNAGEPQAALWKKYCYSQEPEELLSKVGFRETRAYLRRVLTSAAHYTELY